MDSAFLLLDKASIFVLPVPFDEVNYSQFFFFNFINDINDVGS